MEPQLVLLPQPKRVDVRNGSLSIGKGARIIVPQRADQAVMVAASRLRETATTSGCSRWTIHAGDLRVRAYRDSSLPTVVCSIDPDRSGGKEAAYRLDVTPDGVRIAATDVSGLTYALVTLTQLVRQEGTRLRYLAIEDWPTIGRRGVMLDQSRDRVATLETLKVVAEDMAVLKLNELHLYSEHTFAYVDRDVVWAGDDAIRPEEILELDAYCRERLIDLVPTMNSLGHQHKWLEHPEYADLAENYPYVRLPEMARITTYGERRPLWGDVPYSLAAVDPRSAAFIDELMDELLPHFSSKFFNPNVDEPFDLGLGRSHDEVAKRGRAWVYLDYLRRQNARVRARGLTMLFGADVTWSDPEIIDHLPKDAITMDWGYCREFPFREHAQGFSSAGQPFYVLTGTNSWETIVGATDDMFDHHRLAAAAVEEFGGLGLLLTDWGHYDHGTTQQFIISYPGIAAVAAEGWSPGRSAPEDLSEGISRHLFGEADNVMGRLLFELGALSSVVGLLITDIGGVHATVRSPVFQAMRGTLADARQSLEAVGTTREQLESVLTTLDGIEGASRASTSERADAQDLIAELEYTITMMRHACRRSLLATEGDPSSAEALAGELRREVPGLLADFSSRWLRRYRAANLWSTVERLARINDDYRVAAQDGVRPLPGTAA